jgi:hypothetical protein
VKFAGYFSGDMVHIGPKALTNRGLLFSEILGLDVALCPRRMYTPSQALVIQKHSVLTVFLTVSDANSFNKI